MSSIYTQTLGLRVAADYGFAKFLQVAPTSYLTLVDGTEGMHTPDEQKAVTVSFFTDDLEGWYPYVSETDAFELRSTEIQADSVGRFRAFVGYDPEGYYLEFDTFLPHKLNVRLLESLNR